MKPTLLLGIGCQKGGTTWLYEYLARHPQVARDPVKELHVLDVRHVPYFADFHDSKAAYKRELIANLGKDGSERAVRRRDRLAGEIEGHERSMAMVRDPQRYGDHLQGLLESDPAIRLVTDITPSYAALDAAHWQQVRRDLGERFDLRLVFIMRDPIDRLFSAYRMGRRRAEDFNSLAAAASPLEAARSRLRPLKASVMGLVRGRPKESPFVTFALEEMNLRRSQYEKTIEAVEAAFPADQFHCVLFEDLFNEAALRRLTDFAGIDFVPTEYAKTVQTASGGAELTAADALKLFPAGMAGPEGLKAIRAVLPRDTLVYVVGGAAPETFAAWKAAGADGFGLGSSLFQPDWPLTRIAQAAAASVAAYDAARGSMTA